MHEDWARSVLADPDLGPEPASTVDPARAVRDGQRRTRVRRITTATLAVTVTGTALAAALVPVALTAGDPDDPPPVTASGGPSPSAGSSTPTAPSGAPAPPPAPTGCVRQPLGLPAGRADASVFDADPTGRYTVGIAHRDPAEQRDGSRDHVVDPDESGQLVLWDGVRPALLRPPASGMVQGLRVNSAGTVVVALVVDHETPDARAANWLYRDGTFTALRAPGRWYSAQGINTRGDVVGAWLDGPGVHPPIVWPAGTPDRPRELAGGDPGDDTAAYVGGIDDDGTVVGTAAPARSAGSAPPSTSAYPRALYWPAGGAARELPTPPGFGPHGWALAVRGGTAVGHVERPDPDADRRGNRAAIWDLRTGAVRLDDRLSYAGAVNVHGWLVGRTAEEPPGRPVAVFGGEPVPLPMPGPPAPDSGGGMTISDDGRTVTGAVRGASGSMEPVRWRCS